MNVPARILSILLTLVWVTLTYLGFVAADDDPILPTAVVLLGLALTACAALLAAWRWPRAGGWVAVVAGVGCLITVASITTSGPVAMVGLWMALPFILAGLLFVATGEAVAGRVRFSRPAVTLISVAVIVMTLALVVMTFGLGITG